MVGLGITGPPQVTFEAAGAMAAADKLLYLALNPITQYWIEGLNSTAESLHDTYGPDKPRAQTYVEMCERIVGHVMTSARVCVAFYGHPGVLVHASHWAIDEVRAAGGTAHMFPAVSAEGCLFADLGINPGDHGWQCHEATTFLLRRKRIDPTSELILWQAGVLGEATTQLAPAAERPARLLALVKELRKYYPASHEVTVYSSATMPGLAPQIQKLTLEQLPGVSLSRTATLYLPALPQRPVRQSVARWFTRM